MQTCKYTLLYVEDEKEVRQNYVQYLERYFDHVYEAGDTQKAWQIYKKNRPDILIVDINLPGQSGMDFLREIRKSDHTIKTIMLTAKSDVQTLLAATELKLTKYLIKPVSRGDLKEAIALVKEELENFSVQTNKIIKLKESYAWDNENKILSCSGEEKSLTKKEMELLTLLVSNTNKIFSAEEIIFELWYDADEPKNDTLKTLIKNLRRKLPEDSIKNIFGVGYKLELKL